MICRVLFHINGSSFTEPYACLVSTCDAPLPCVSLVMSIYLRNHSECSCMSQSCVSIVGEQSEPTGELDGKLFFAVYVHIGYLYISAIYSWTRVCRRFYGLS